MRYTLFALAMLTLAAPQHAAAAPLTPPPAQVEWVAGGAACLIGLFAAVIIINIRRAGRRRADANLSGIRVRSGDDGFWLEAPELRPGTRVRYRCTVAGAPRPGWAKMGLGETFVYTGGAPSAIRLLEVEEAPAAGGPQPPQEPTRYGTLDLAPPAPGGTSQQPPQAG